MDVDHKDFIDKNYMLFTELLRLKSIPLIRYLYDEQVLTEKQATKTMDQVAHTLRTMHLLDNMMPQGKDAFDSLYAAILYTKSWRTADLLEPKKRPHQAIAEEPQIPLPDVWPDEDHFKGLESKELEIKQVDPKDARMEEWYEQSKKNNIYDLRAKVKGRVLIINNHNFDNLTTRFGSEKDVEGLMKIFKGLGFEPESQQDLTCDEMRDLLNRECRKDHTDFNCFFLIIMTHGHRGVDYGTDGYMKRKTYFNSLNIEDIKNQFYKVKSLERKPKVFIIQACQGSEKDTGQKEKAADDEDDEEDRDEEDETGSTAADSPGPAASGGEAATEPRNEEIAAPAEGNREVAAGGNNEAGLDPLAFDSDDEEDDEGDDDIPCERESADSITAEAPFHFLVAMATTEGNLSYRHKLHGSWFIQAFIFVFATYSWKEDLLTLMEKVNELVRRAKTEKLRRHPKHYLQVSQITNTFIKRFFFFPGMPLEKKKKPKKPSMPLSALTSVHI